jgi:hypothetical protein
MAAHGCPITMCIHENNETRGLILMCAVVVVIWENERSFAQPPIMSVRLQVASPLRFHICTYTTVAAAAPSPLRLVLTP